MLVSPNVDGLLKEFSQSAGVCALCQGPFLDSWLDCVKFVDIKMALPSIKTPSQGRIPFYAPQCSYTSVLMQLHTRESSMDLLLFSSICLLPPSILSIVS